MKLVKGLLIFFLFLTIILAFDSKNREEKRVGSVPLINSSMDSLTISCDYTRQDLLQGLTAYDVEDGYITDSIIPGPFESFTEKGVSEIEYFVYDSADNCGRYKRKIIFSDYISPKLTLSGPLVFYVKEASDGDVIYCLHATDCLDGDLKQIRVDKSNINYAAAGDYKITVSLVNSFGDTASYNLPVHIIRKSYRGLDIRLKENLIYLKSGSDFDPAAYVKEVEQSMTEELLPQKDWGINIQSNVDTSKPGVYEVQYMIEKKEDKVYGSVSGITWLTVIVTD